jgi:hypothetical protein
MQWLMVVLLVSAFALLLVAAGVARHIRRQRAKSINIELGEVIGHSEETDLESKV